MVVLLSVWSNSTFMVQHVFQQEAYCVIQHTDNVQIGDAGPSILLERF